MIFMSRLLLITIKQKGNMNNFKKVGLTALAGSLGAATAYAGEVTVAGSASMKLDVDGGAAEGKYSMGTNYSVVLVS